MIRGCAFGALAVGLMGMGSCSQSVELICTERLPAFRQTLDLALQKAEPGRQLASSGAQNSEEAEEWQVWAEKHLKEVQYWTDAAEGHAQMAELRRELNSLANALVMVHGSAQRGNFENLSRWLKTSRERVDTLQRAICSSP